MGVPHTKVMIHSASSASGRSTIRSGLTAFETNVAECSYRPRFVEPQRIALPLSAQVRRIASNSATKHKINRSSTTSKQVSDNKRSSSTFESHRFKDAPEDSLVFPPAPQPSPETLARDVSTSLASIQSGLQIPSNVLLDVLTTKDRTYYQLLRSKLPPDFHRLDAYILLRSQDPAKLSGLSEMDIDRLIKRAGKEGLAGVLSLLLEDITGSINPAAKAHSGYFRVPAGSQTRYHLLKTLLLNCNRGDLLQNDGLALHLFQLLVEDFKSVSNPSASRTSSVPSNFPQGDARNLVRRILHVKSTKLLPVLQALRTHLERRTSDFPSAREASQLIEFYLQPDIRDFAAALDVVRTLRDTHGLGQDSIDQAVRDGKNYFDYLKASSEHLDAKEQSTLEQISLEVSLRLISMKCHLVQHPEGGAQYLSTFHSLMDSFRLDLLPDAAIFDTSASPGVIAFKAFRNTVLHLLGQPGSGSLQQVLAMMQRCDSRLLALLSSRDIQDLCDVGTAHEMLSIVVQAYFLIIKAKARIAMRKGNTSTHAHSLVRDGFLVNTDTFISLLHQLNSTGNSLSTKAIVRGLRLLPFNPTSLAQMHIRFEGAQRPRFIGALAGAHMKEEAFELFQLWSDTHYDPDLARARVSAPIGDSFRPNAHHERRFEELKEDVNFVASSASCVVALVKSLCRGTTSRILEPGRPAHNPLNPDAEERVLQAEFALEVFKRAQDPSNWTHYNLTALATACFYVRDIKGAFTALSRISFMRHTPDAVDISVLIGGLMAFDPDKAVDLFISHSTFVDQLQIKAPPKVRQRNEEANRPDSKDSIQSADAGTLMDDGSIPHIKRVPEASKANFAPMRPSARLASILLSRAMAQGRLDLVNKLIGFADEAGISSSLGLAASSSLLYQADMAPTEVVKVVKRLLASGWPADPALLEFAARQVLKSHSLNLRQAKESEMETEDQVGAGSDARKPKKESALERLSSVQTAVYLMEVSLATKNVVNLLTVKIALNKIRNSGYRFLPRIAASELRSKPKAGRADSRARWIACIDRVVYALRWSSFFDTGHDYRQGLPLWKSSKTVDGGLLPVDLDDLYNFAFSAKVSRRIQDQSLLPIPPEEFSKETVLGDDGTEKDVQSLKRKPNVLSSQTFCRILEAYLAWGDTQGAAEVAAWMRDEAGADVGHTNREVDEFVGRIKVALDKQQESRSRLATQESSDGSEILGMLSGQQSTPRLKAWWGYRG